MAAKQMRCRAKGREFRAMPMPPNPKGGHGLSCKGCGVTEPVPEGYDKVKCQDLGPCMPHERGDGRQKVWKEVKGKRKKVRK